MAPAGVRGSSAECGDHLCRRWMATIIGLHLGVLQVCAVLVVQTLVSATYLIYFAVVVAWLAGALIGLSLSRPRTLRGALLLSGASHGALIALGWWSRELLPVITLGPLLTIAIALPGGVYFRLAGRRGSGRGRLLLWENNGFIAGTVIGLLGFALAGVAFALAAPAISVAALLLAASGRTRIAAAALTLAGAALAIIGGISLTAVVAATATVLIGATVWDRMRAVGARSSEKSGPPKPVRRPSANCAREPRTAPWLVALSGATLVTFQSIAVREFSTALSGSELTIILVGIGVLVGISVGYAVGDRVPAGALRALGPAFLLLHATLALGARPVVATCIAHGVGESGVVGLLLLTALGGSAYCAIFLPRAVATLARGSVRRGLRWDLAGALVGSVVVALAVWVSPALLLPLHLCGMLALVALTRWGQPSLLPVVGTGFAVVVVIAIHQGELRRAAVTDDYRARGYRNPVVIFSRVSAYHTVEVIDTHRDTGATEPVERIAFLNGVRHFSRRLPFDDRDADSSLGEFLYFLAGLPGRVLARERGRPLDILVLGGGSLDSLRRLAPVARSITLVELDPVVIQAARRCWRPAPTAYGREADDGTAVRIVVGDAFRVLSDLDRRFDLIVNDVSAPYYLGSARMHGLEVFRLARGHLRPGGLFVDSTQGALGRDGRDGPERILAGVTRVFPHVLSVETERPRRRHSAYLYASTSPIALESTIRTELARSERAAGTHLDSRPLRARGDLPRPFSATCLQGVLESGVRRLRGRLGSASSGRPESHQGLWADMTHLETSRAVSRLAASNSGGGAVLATLLALITAAGVARAGRGPRGDSVGGAARAPRGRAVCEGRTR